MAKKKSDTQAAREEVAENLGEMVARQVVEQSDPPPLTIVIHHHHHEDLPVPPAPDPALVIDGVMMNAKTVNDQEVRFALRQAHDEDGAGLPFVSAPVGPFHALFHGYTGHRVRVTIQDLGL